MAGESGRVASVAGQEGDRVLLSVPMVGFPPGFQLRRGERVVVVIDDPAGLAARPLVKKLVVSAASANLAATGALEAGGQQLVLQEATVRADVPASAGAQAGQQVIFVVDSAGGGEPPQVVAVRTPVA